MKYYLIVAIMFFVVTFPLMKIASYVENKVKEKGFMHD
jgi:ABC-type amino acid transport system permease subunit